jgi:hypothetical protein
LVATPGTRQVPLLTSALRPRRKKSAIRKRVPTFLDPQAWGGGMGPVEFGQDNRVSRYRGELRDRCAANRSLRRKTLPWGGTGTPSEGSSFPRLACLNWIGEHLGTRAAEAAVGLAGCRHQHDAAMTGGVGLGHASPDLKRTLGPCVSPNADEGPCARGRGIDSVA